MANTYTLIEAKTLGSAVASVTFSSIPQTYTDLKLVMSARTTAGGNVSDNAHLSFNNASDRYYEILLYGVGDGSNGSASASNANTYLQWGGSATGSSATTNTFGNAEVYIPNYTSSNGKSISVDWVNESNVTSAWVALSAGLWNPTTNAAITSLKVEARAAATSFAVYSTFYLYGIKKD
jgi:hypothetical protein